MTWYSRLFRVLLSTAVLIAGVGWCCAHDTVASSVGRSLAGHAHHDAPASKSLATKTTPPASRGSDPSPSPDQDDSGCGSNITLVSTNFTAGTVLACSGSYNQDAFALTLPANQAVWLALDSPTPSGFETPRDIFRGDSLRALSCLITV
jgi:hypothetical protein